MKVLIIGGVAGGASAAARLRRVDEEAEIILFEKGSYISYANCGLPYYIGGVINEAENLFLQTPESMKEKFNIDVRVNSEVVAIFSDSKEIEVLDKKSGKRYKEAYDKLVLSPGAEPIKPRIEGIDAENIFTLRNVTDTFAIKQYVDTKKPQEAVVVGGGFIGVEMAENLIERGVNVTLIELSNQVMAPLDIEMASFVHQKLTNEGIKLILSDGVKAFKKADKHTEVELNSGKTVKADLIIMAIGVRPDVSLAREAGLKLGLLGGIVVDDQMKTSNSDIYAVGDAIEVTDIINNNNALIPLAGPANKQGRIAANNIVGREEAYKGTLGTSIVKIFDMTAAAVGNNEKILQKYKLKYEKVYTHSPSHAGYYPNAIPMSIKLIFEPEEGKVLGAQIVGYEGVDKRIDVIATAIKAGMTVYDLQELELAYAPPYSSAKDPVNMAGYVASNVLLGDSQIIHWSEMDSLDRKSAAVIDVRTDVEFNMGNIEGAINLSIEEIRNRLDEIPKDKQIILYCQTGIRSYFVYRMLVQQGFKNIKNLSGGFKTYQVAHERYIDAEVQRDSRITSNDIFKASACLGEECSSAANVKLDACGLQCPGPIMKVNTAISGMNFGEVLEVKATDPAFKNDIKAWCNNTGNILAGLKKENGATIAYVKKGSGKLESRVKSGNDKTLVIFDGDLDKAIASFIIANGAVAMGNKVTMFFTFWGLNVLRKHQGVKVKKNMLEKMFSIMMPRGSQKLTLSKMNMGGLGSKMIRYVMRSKNIESLEDLIEKAIEQGVKLVACSMSMDVMGIKKEELIDGVEEGGVATMLDSADRSNMTMFI